MAGIFEFNMEESEFMDNDRLGILYSDVVYMTLTLKGYGYDDDDVYTILGMLLNLDISPENIGIKRFDSLTESIRNMTENGEADEFIEILKMIRKKD